MRDAMRVIAEYTGSERLLKFLEIGADREPFPSLIHFRNVARIDIAKLDP